MLRPSGVNQSYLNEVWGGVEPTHVAHLLVALCAAVVVGWLRGAADVEVRLAERTASFGLGVLLLLLSWSSGPLLCRLRSRRFTCPRPRARWSAWFGGWFWRLLLGGLRYQSTSLVKERRTKAKQLSERLLWRWGLS